jgi:flagellar biosynthesis protein FliR
MVVVPFLRNNPSAVMFFQRFIFPAKTLWGKIFGAHLGFSLQVYVDLFQEISPRIARQLRF